MAKMVQLSSGSVLSSGGKRISDTCLEKDVIFVYDGDFESKDGPVQVSRDHISHLVSNHNGFMSKLKRLATNGTPELRLQDCPPLQLDHSRSARDTVGRVYGDMWEGIVEVDGTQRLAACGKVRFLGKENVEKAEDGRYTHFSIGADLEDPKKSRLNELSVVPFPAAAHATYLSAKPVEMSDADVREAATAAIEYAKGDRAKLDEYIKRHGGDNDFWKQVKEQVERRFSPSKRLSKTELGGEIVAEFTHKGHEIWASVTDNGGPNNLDIVVNFKDGSQQSYFWRNPPKGKVELNKVLEFLSSKGVRLESELSQTEMAQLGHDLRKKVLHKGKTVQAWENGYKKFIVGIDGRLQHDMGEFESAERAIAYAIEFLDNHSEMSGKEDMKQLSSIKVNSGPVTTIEIKDTGTAYEVWAHFDDGTENKLDAFTYGDVLSQEQAKTMAQASAQANAEHPEGVTRLSEGEKMDPKALMKKHLETVHKMSPEEADKKLASMSDEDQKKLSAEAEEHEKKMSEAEKEKKELAEKEEQDKKAKELAAAPKGTQLSADDKKSITELVGAFRSTSKGVSLEARKAGIVTRLAGLRAKALMTPAEEQSVNLEKLLAKSETELNSFFEGFEFRQPVIPRGAYGSVKAVPVSELGKDEAQTALMLETAQSMPLTGKGFLARAGAALMGKQEGDQKEVASTKSKFSVEFTDRAMSPQVELGALVRVRELMDAGKHEEAGKALGVCLAGAEPTSSISQMTTLSALAENAKKMENQFQSLLKLVSPLLKEHGIEIENA